VAIVIDQDARGDGVFVPFFGRLASTTPTLALLALRTGAEIIPCSCRPEGDGSYTIVYDPPVEVRESGDRDADLLRLTAECTAVIERWVRERPELWLWMHRRWKTRPAEESPAAGVPFRAPER
jgi:KDO2-lipid IV(A) lauroyltransferase